MAKVCRQGFTNWRKAQSFLIIYSNLVKFHSEPKLCAKKLSNCGFESRSIMSISGSTGDVKIAHLYFIRRLSRSKVASCYFWVVSRRLTSWWAPKWLPTDLLWISFKHDKKSFFRIMCLLWAKNCLTRRSMVFWLSQSSSRGLIWSKSSAGSSSLKPVSAWVPDYDNWGLVVVVIEFWFIVMCI